MSATDPNPVLHPVRYCDLADREAAPEKLPDGDHPFLFQVVELGVPVARELMG